MVLLDWTATGRSSWITGDLNEVDFLGLLLLFPSVDLDILLAGLGGGGTVHLDWDLTIVLDESAVLRKGQAEPSS